MIRREIIVNDSMQKDYRYFLTERPGKNFHAGFCPELTPKQMLSLGVFGGKYMTDCRAEFSPDWFENARLCHEKTRSRTELFQSAGITDSSGMDPQRMDL